MTTVRIPFSKRSDVVFDVTGALLADAFGADNFQYAYHIKASDLGAKAVAHMVYGRADGVDQLLYVSAFRSDRKIVVKNTVRFLMSGGERPLGDPFQVEAPVDVLLDDVPCQGARYGHRTTCVLGRTRSSTLWPGVDDQIPRCFACAQRASEACNG